MAYHFVGEVLLHPVEMEFKCVPTCNIVNIGKLKGLTKTIVKGRKTLNLG